MKSTVILKIGSYEGRDTFIRCGNDDQDFIFVIVSIGKQGKAEIVDAGYRSYEEAAAAWPEAALSKGKA